jgi:hypothetical protein
MASVLGTLIQGRRCDTELPERRRATTQARDHCQPETYRVDRVIDVWANSPLETHLHLHPFSFKMTSDSQQPRRLFQWTVCAYRKPGMSEEDYHKYMSEKHAPLVRGLMAQYGIVQFTMASINLFDSKWHD